MFEIRAECVLNSVAQGKAVSSVAAGSACSYAVLADGSAYAWGFAENLQLTTGEDEVIDSSGKKERKS